MRNSDCYEERAKTARGTPDHERILQEWRTNCDYQHAQNEWRMHDWNNARRVNYDSNYTWLGGPRGSGLRGPVYEHPMRRPYAVPPPCAMGVTPSGSLIKVRRVDSQAPQGPQSRHSAASSDLQDRLKQLPRENILHWLHDLPSHFDPSSTGMWSHYILIRG